MGLAELIRRQQELLNAAKAAGRTLTEEEQAEFDDLQRQVDAILQKSEEETGGNGRETESEGTRAEERQRCAEITSICREFDVADEDMKRYLNEGTAVDAVRAAILNNMRAQGAPVAVK